MWGAWREFQNRIGPISYVEIELEFEVSAMDLPGGLSLRYTRVFVKID